MVIIKEIQLDSKEVEEAIALYLKNEVFEAISFRFAPKDQSLGILNNYPITASIVVEDLETPN